MPKISIVAGSTSKLVNVFMQDTSKNDGSGLTGLVFNSSGLSAYYYREGAGSAAAITLATTTLGTWGSGGFIAIDGTNMPGCYQIGLPDAALTSGAKSVLVMLKGATNMAPLPLEIELTAWNNQTAFTIQKNAALSNFEFPMYATSDGTPKTGLTVTAQRSIDGGSFASCSNSASELASGIYTISLSASDLNGSVITLRFTGSDAQDTLVTIVTQG